MTKLKKKMQDLASRGRLIRLAAVLIFISLLSTACFNKGGEESAEQLQPANTSTSESRETQGSTLEPETLPKEPATPRGTNTAEERNTAEETNSPTGGIADRQSDRSVPSAGSESIDREQQPDLSQATKAKKQSIDKKVEGKITALRDECKEKSELLLQSVIEELSGNEEATLKTLQAKFAGKLLAAEAGCDGGFEALLKAAADEYAEAGIPDAAMPDWSSQYREEKAAVRASAITKLIAAMK